MMSGGETERQRSFAHACLSNLAIDSMIRAKIVHTATSGAETARAQALADVCRRGGEPQQPQPLTSEAEQQQQGRATPTAAAASEDPAGAVDLQ